MAPGRLQEHLLAPRLWRLLDLLGWAIAVFLFLYWATSFRFDRVISDPLRQVDFGLQYMYAGQILDRLRYPAQAQGSWALVFPYPPSGVAMLLPLTLMPRTAAFVLWICLQGLSLAAVVWSSLRLSGAAHWRGAVLLASIAIAFAEYPLSWDLRSHNNNTIYLALVMLGLVAGRTWLSGLLLGASAALKIYSSLLFFLFAWRREYRRAFWIGVALILFGLVIPAVVFGPAGFVQLVLDWIEEVRYTASLAGYNAEAPIISIRHALSWLLSADPSSMMIIALWRAAQLSWALVVIWYFVTAARPKQDERSGITTLTDACVIIMAPLPLSTWLEPHHVVVLLPAFVLLLTVMVRPNWPMRVRLLSALALMSSPLVPLILRKLEARGAVFLIVFTLIVWALSSIRAAAVAFGATAQSPTDQPLMAMAQRAATWSSAARQG